MNYGQSSHAALPFWHDHIGKVEFKALDQVVVSKRFSRSHGGLWNRMKNERNGRVSDIIWCANHHNLQKNLCGTIESRSASLAACQRSVNQGNKHMRLGVVLLFPTESRVTSEAAVAFLYPTYETATLPDSSDVDAHWTCQSSVVVS